MVFNDREYARPTALPDWIKEFADKNLKKGESPFETIKDIFRKNDTNAVEAKVEEIRKRIGLDKIEKNATIRHVERVKERGEGTTMKWCVYPKSGGEALGCHDTKKEAENQLAAIEISKHNADDYFIQEVEDEIFGGLGDDHLDNRYDKEQLEEGIKVELEHTDDCQKAREIAKDHLEESKDYRDGDGGKYYDKLKEMEEDIEKELVANKINDLIRIANFYDKIGDYENMIEIDDKIKKLANKMQLKNNNFKLSCRNKLSKRSNFFLSIRAKLDNYHDGIKRHIDNICESRDGHISAPALMDIILSRPEKLSDKDRNELKEYIKNKIKETRRELNFKDDDNIIGLNTNSKNDFDDEQNSEVFSRPADK